uniref:Uncharacterized protein n=1 Tax=Oryza meridionalis TaxID=40149 RepID=A0A0E0CK09_9ORYZ
MTERHCDVTILSERVDKRGLQAVRLFHADLMISQIAVVKAEKVADGRRINDLIDARFSVSPGSMIRGLTTADQSPGGVSSGFFRSARSSGIIFLLGGSGNDHSLDLIQHRSHVFWSIVDVGVNQRDGHHNVLLRCSENIGVFYAGLDDVVCNVTTSNQIVLPSLAFLLSFGTSFLLLPRDVGLLVFVCGATDHEDFEEEWGVIVGKFGATETINVKVVVAI